VNRGTQIFFAYFIFLFVSLPLIHNSHNAYFSAFILLRFIHIFAVIIENVVIDINLKCEILRKKKLVIREQIISH